MKRVDWLALGLECDCGEKTFCLVLSIGQLGTLTFFKSNHAGNFDSPS